VWSVSFSVARSSPERETVLVWWALGGVAAIRSAA